MIDNSKINRLVRINYTYNNYTYNVHLQGNNDIAPLFIQLTKCTLNSSRTNFILLACLSYAKAIANAMANKPQSTPPICF